MRTRHLMIAMLLALVAVFAVACGQAPITTDGAEESSSAECPELVCEECEACPEPSAVEVIPFLDDWQGSAHAASDTEPFRHWDEDDPAEVPETCARCHTSAGFRDYVGADGSAFGSVEMPYPPEQVGIVCEACHSDATRNLTSVVMPSGVEITGIGESARCMQCHQGRESTVSVNLRISGAEAVGEDDPLGYALLADRDLDAVDPELGFANIHYYPAAATLFGSETHGGYEFEGKVYQIRTSHVDEFSECIDCHNQHTLEIRVEKCAQCHEGVETVDDLYDNRMNGSLMDYDGDGDIEEGIYYELQSLSEQLYVAIQAYATDVAGTPIVYDTESYPYFFIDDGNGVVDDGEAVSDNRYNAWTPRLLMAAYNYQMWQKDPGAFAHNPKYHVALLYDSIEAMGGDVSGLARNDAGHFDGTAYPFRRFDAQGVVPGTCARCHSGEGIPTLLAEGVNVSAPPANGYKCSNCHAELGGEWPRREAESATFPSGAVLSFAENPDANLCIQCHQGRESGPDVDAAIGTTPPDGLIEGGRFINIHYFPAGVTVFGGNANGAYQYANREYAGQLEHVSGYDSCVECHNVHALEVNQEGCADCHEEGHHHEFRVRDGDFDGDGNDTEGIGQEVEGLIELLYTSIQANAAGRGTPIVYESHTYPYFFNDLNENGEADADEAIRDNAFSFWTPRLLRAAYNYQYAQKDPGAFAHNPDYVMQILYDSIQDVGGSTAGLTRP